MNFRISELLVGFLALGLIDQLDDVDHVDSVINTPARTTPVPYPISDQEKDKMVLHVSDSMDFNSPKSIEKMPLADVRKSD